MFAAATAAAAKSVQSCPTLCGPIDGSPPGSPVPGILQARTLEWDAISYSSGMPLPSPETPGVTGKFGLEIRNEARQRLIEFCQENALVIANILFQQHKRRLLRVPWTPRRSNQSSLNKNSAEYSFKRLMLKLKLQYLDHLMGSTDSFEMTLMLGIIEGRRRR